MSDSNDTDFSDTDSRLPPKCPRCAHMMGLKEVHRSSANEGYTCFFRCEGCGLQYPCHVTKAEGLVFAESLRQAKASAAQAPLVVLSRRPGDD